MRSGREVGGLRAAPVFALVALFEEDLGGRPRSACAFSVQVGRGSGSVSGNVGLWAWCWDGVGGRQEGVLEVTVVAAVGG